MQDLPIESHLPLRQEKLPAWSQCKRLSLLIPSFWYGWFCHSRPWALIHCPRTTEKLHHIQVSEDHCWVNFSPDGSREGSVEVTTDAAASRGKVVSEAAWQGWLYTGGHAVLCSNKASSVRPTDHLCICWSTNDVHQVWCRRGIKMAFLLVVSTARKPEQ